MSIEVNNKTVLVTGANRGIGRSIVEEALRRGAAKIYAAVRRLENAQPLVEEFGDRIQPVQLDLTDGDSVLSAAKTADDVEIVINNAGVLKTSTAVGSDAIELMKYEIDVNVYGLIRVARAFAPVLKSNGGGALVQLNSVASIKNFPDFATYSASKAASYSLTQGLRDTLSEQGTQVLSVHPGPIATDMAHDAGLGEIAESPTLVAEAIFDALAASEFHAWPDSMAKQFAEAYDGFAKGVVEAEAQESPA